jgi:hypothetical protein
MLGARSCRTTAAPAAWWCGRSRPEAPQLRERELGSDHDITCTAGEGKAMTEKRRNPQRRNLAQHPDTVTAWRRTT